MKMYGKKKTCNKMHWLFSIIIRTPTFNNAFKYTESLFGTTICASIMPSFENNVFDGATSISSTNLLNPNPLQPSAISSYIIRTKGKIKNLLIWDRQMKHAPNKVWEHNWAVTTKQASTLKIINHLIIFLIQT